MHRTLLLTALASVLLTVPAASVDDAIDRHAASFERGLKSAFGIMRKKIDSFAQKHRLERLALANKAMQADSANAQFFAGRILLASPHNKTARAILEEAGVPVPGAGVAAPRPASLASRRQVIGIHYPPLAETRAFLVANAGSWAKKYKRESVKLLQKLLAIGKAGHGNIAYPVLAQYFPKSPQVRKVYPAAAKVAHGWLTPFDRHLLAKGLAGVDPETYPPAKGKGGKRSGETLTLANGSWNFPRPIANLRLELVGYHGGQGSLAVRSRSGRQFELFIEPGAVRLSGATKASTITLPADVATIGVDIVCEIAGAKGRLVIDAGETVLFDLPGKTAFASFATTGGLKTLGCTCRFVDELKLGPPVRVATKVTPPKPPAPPCWLAERKQQLQQRVTFAFTDATLKSVVRDLAKLAGVPISLAPSAVDLADLPLNLAGEDRSLEQVFAMLGRSLDLSNQPTEQGFVLGWGD